MPILMHLFIVPGNHAWPLFSSINQSISLSNKLLEAQQNSSTKHHMEEYPVWHWPQLVRKLSFSLAHQLWWQTSQCCRLRRSENLTDRKRGHHPLTLMSFQTNMLRNRRKNTDKIYLGFNIKVWESFRTAVRMVTCTTRPAVYLISYHVHILYLVANVNSLLSVILGCEIIFSKIYFQTCQVGKMISKTVILWLVSFLCVQL